MAGERPILGLRTGETISPVYERKDLHYLLTEQAQRRPTNIDGIRRDMIQAVGMEFPADFLIESGLADMTWLQVYHRNALSGLYLGRADTGNEALPPNQAEAIIAINSSITEGCIDVQTIHLATTLTDNKGKNRTFAAFFDKSTGVADWTYVSITDKEEPKLGELQHPDYHRSLRAQITTIPTLPPKFRNPLMTPLISHTMVEASGDTKIIRATIRNGTHEEMGFDHYGMTQNGFYERKVDDDNRAIGKYDLPELSWEIVYPARLINFH